MRSWRASARFLRASGSIKEIPPSEEHEPQGVLGLQGELMALDRRNHLGVREPGPRAQCDEALLFLLVRDHLGRRVERPYSAAEQAREVGRGTHEALERARR